MSASTVPATRLRVRDALRALDLPITPSHVSRLIRQGRLPAEKIGQINYIDPAVLRAYLVREVQP